ncbi:MAG: DUF393 domain-containing protein [Flavobacteriales bacterium]|nr:DUF393 domain-containing protein [Flavobacteriales bacterium]
MNDLPAQPILLFDGECILCNRMVQFVIRNDHRKKIRLTTLQSEKACQLLNATPVSLRPMESLIYVRAGKVHEQSTASLWVCYDLGGLWQIFIVLLLVPPFIRNMVYRFIARNRYKWFGRMEQCMIPDDDVRDRFL